MTAPPAEIPTIKGRGTAEDSDAGGLGGGGLGEGGGLGTGGGLGGDRKMALSTGIAMMVVDVTLGMAGFRRSANAGDAAVANIWLATSVAGVPVFVATENVTFVATPGCMRRRLVCTYSLTEVTATFSGATPHVVATALENAAALKASGDTPLTAMDAITFTDGGGGGGDLGGGGDGIGGGGGGGEALGGGGGGGEALGGGGGEG